MAYRSIARRSQLVIGVAGALVLAGSVPVADAAPGGAGPNGGGPSHDRTTTSPADWAQAGHDVADTRSNPVERHLTNRTVTKMKPRWVATVGGNVSTTPTVVRDRVYVPDWGGNLWSFDAATGKVVWRHTIDEYSGIEGDVSRTSPAYWKGNLYFGQGAQGVEPKKQPIPGAFILSARAKDGSPGWRTRVDADPTAIITQSPTVADGVVYVGVSSKAEAIDGPTHFRGSMVALSARTGRILWKTWTIPDPKTGYTGGAVWGNSPAVDRRRRLVYITTGNNENVPDGVCTRPNETGCRPVAADNHVDSIMALDTRTGAIRWATPTLSSDVSTNFNHQGPDFDFGSGANLFSVTRGHRRVDLVGAGQKSGIYWALNPDTGKVVWTADVGPGSLLGGVMWGTAVHDGRIFVSIGNMDGKTVPVTRANGSSATTNAGFWAGIDAATGKVLWRTADPQGAFDQSAMTAAGGVVYAGSTATSGPTMYALDARSGRILWRHASGGAVIAGAAVSRGTAYWGSGYRMAPNNKLYAFSTKRG